MKAANLALKGFTVLLGGFEEALAPGVCLICERRLKGEDKHICKACFTNLPPAPQCEEIYQKFIMNFHPDDIAVSRASGLIAVDREKAALRIVHALKYDGIRSIADRFSDAFSRRLIKDDFVNYDAIIPLPLHAAKKRERGYNQAFLLAAAIAPAIGAKPDERIIRRKKYTETQTALNAEERRSNIAGVFECVASVKGGKFLVIDDVMTTGSTINSAAATLLNAGAASVDAAALVIA